MHGWTGKILEIDLSDATVRFLSTEPYVNHYLGGRGIASRLYWEMVKPEIGAFDPDNRLIFMTGPLAATGAQGATRMTIVAKSPMTLPEGFCYGNIGGYFGGELKKAGYDGLIITGSSEKPVYISIYDDKVEILDAASLWGKGAYRTGEIIEARHGAKTRFLTTGVAGESLVRSAIVLASHQSTATGGFGAVMGSKKLKAIAVKGSGMPSVADPQQLRELNRYTIKISKRLWFPPPIVTITGHGHLLEVVRKGQCHQCGMECFKGIYRYGQRLEGLRRCQSMEYYLPWVFDREEEPLETFFDAPTLANDYSICTFELQGMVEWLYDCYRSGSLSESDTGMPLSKIGTREFLENLLEAVAYRRGFGDILAEGLPRAAAKVPAAARDLLSRLIAPVGKHDLAPPRAIFAHALLYPMEPRVHQPIIHETSTLRMAWNANRVQPGRTPVTNKLFHDIARIFWGSEAAGDLATYEGKALAAVRVQDRTYIKDSLGLCDPAWPINYSFNTPDNLGDPDLEAKIFTAVTGYDGCGISRYGECICNLQRAILIREGRRLPAADFPPDFNFTEPMGIDPRGNRLMVPGPGDEIVDVSGNVLDRDRFGDMLREYYKLRGWDEDTGRPLPATLYDLGLDDLEATFNGP